MEEPHFHEPVSVPSTRFHVWGYSILALVLIYIVLYYFLSAPTNNQSFANREPVVVHVAEGQSLSATALDLQKKNIIRSPRALKLFTRFFAFDKQIAYGDYKFSKPTSLIHVSWMLARGEHNIEPLKITFREGVTNDDIATILSQSFPAFRKDLFFANPYTVQGYLFPDTYFIFPFTTTDEIVHLFSRTFKKRIQPLQKDIAISGHTQEEIIVMSSILEKEAEGKSDAPVIAGILWKRLARSMPLQVDAAKETYAKKGLPSLPIANPGLVSIEAAVHPVDSPYLFYLHDKNGTVHYARTFAEHKANISRYLK